MIVGYSWWQLIAGGFLLGLGWHLADAALGLLLNVIERRR